LCKQYPESERNSLQNVHISNILQSIFLECIRPTSNLISRVFMTIIIYGSNQRLLKKIGICCFSAKHTALRRKSNDWLAQKQDNLSERGDMPIHRLLFQWASTIKIPPKFPSKTPLCKVHSAEKNYQEWLTDCCLMPSLQFSAMSWREQVNFQWEDDEVHFVCVSVLDLIKIWPDFFSFQIASVV
jgi:hypothetical protein